MKKTIHISREEQEKYKHANNLVYLMKSLK